MHVHFGKLEVHESVKPARRQELEALAKALEQPLKVLENHGVDLFIHAAEQGNGLLILASFDGSRMKYVMASSNKEDSSLSVIGKALAVGMQLLSNRRSSFPGIH